jgi:hypothetical protein
MAVLCARPAPPPATRPRLLVVPRCNTRSEPSWVIGADDLAKYQLIFDHHNNEGYVSGPNAAALFNKSGLAKEVGHRYIFVCHPMLFCYRLRMCHGFFPFCVTSLQPLLCGTTVWALFERTASPRTEPSRCVHPMSVAAKMAAAFSTDSEAGVDYVGRGQRRSPGLP